jgi:hypothetical protein
MTPVGYSGTSVTGVYTRPGIFNRDGSPAGATGTVLVTPQGQSTITKTLDDTGSYQVYIGHFSGRVTVVETIEGDPGGVRTLTYVAGGGGTIDTSREI